MWKWIKIPKGIALLAFFLPWMTVSCAGQPLASASGWGLATGNITMAGSVPTGAQSMNIAFIIAIIAIIAGLVMSFRNDGVAHKVVIGTSVIAFAAILIGSSMVSSGISSKIAEAAAKRGGGAGASGGDAGAMMGMGSGGPNIASMIKVEWQMGYWVTLLCLIAAGGMAFMAMTGRTFSSLSGGTGTEPPAPTPPSDI
jgi:hypothetical protein